MTHIKGGVLSRFAESVRLSYIEDLAAKEKVDPAKVGW
jgi:hypothetical protein